MKQKIEWYKEVLEIEPNSKIFFPLARMLTKDGRPDEAIVILRQGVGRHPDHVEARLFLAELLYSSKKVIELQQEIDVLSVLFKNYPGFWRAWGERLFDEDATRDAGLAAIFMAAFLQNLPVSWAGVIEHGLKSLVGGESLGQAPTSEVRPMTAPGHVPPVLGASAAPISVAPVVQSPEALSVNEEERHKAVEAAPVVPSDVLPEPSFDNSEEDETEEPITLRTRSMAEVLAEQDDLAGALDIYNDLLAASSSDAEKKELQARVDALSGKVTQGAAPSDEAQAGKEEKKDWLAILAQRLEARSLQ